VEHVAGQFGEGKRFVDDLPRESLDEGGVSREVPAARREGEAKAGG
jgi:hypothetical protein